MIKVTFEVQTQEEFEFAYQRLMPSLGEVCDGVFECLVSVVKTSPPQPPLLLRGGVPDKFLEELREWEKKQGWHLITVEDVSLEMMQDDTTPIVNETKEFFEMRNRVYSQLRKEELEALKVSETVRVGADGLCKVLGFLGKKGNI